MRIAAWARPSSDLVSEAPPPPTRPMWMRSSRTSVERSRTSPSRRTARRERLDLRRVWATTPGATGSRGGSATRGSTRRPRPRARRPHAARAGHRRWPRRAELRDLLQHHRARAGAGRRPHRRRDPPRLDRPARLEHAPRRAERRLTLGARAQVLDEGKVLVVDANMRPNRWPDHGAMVEATLELLQGAFLAKMNRDEAEWLTGESDPGRRRSRAPGRGGAQRPSSRAGSAARSSAARAAWRARCPGSRAAEEHGGCRRCCHRRAARCARRERRLRARAQRHAARCDAPAAQVVQQWGAV